MSTDKLFQPTLCLFIKDFLSLPVLGSGTKDNVMRVPSAAVPPSQWVELVGRVMDVSFSSNPLCFTSLLSPLPSFFPSWFMVLFSVDDGTDACECLWFKTWPGDKPATIAKLDVEPEVGNHVLVRGMLHTRDRFHEDSRKLCVTAVRALSPISDDILLAHAERKDMRTRYGIR